LDCPARGEGIGVLMAARGWVQTYQKPMRKWHEHPFSRHFAVKRRVIKVTAVVPEF
jgi:hypothetical protein